MDVIGTYEAPGPITDISSNERFVKSDSLYCFMNQLSDLGLNANTELKTLLHFRYVLTS